MKTALLIKTSNEIFKKKKKFVAKLQRILSPVFMRVSTS
jgi:hypothetical protein